MKKHNGHFQGPAHSKSRHAPSGLRATWALDKAQKHKTMAAKQSALRGGEVPATSKRRAKAMASTLRAMHARSLKERLAEKKHAEHAQVAAPSRSRNVSAGMKAELEQKKAQVLAAVARKRRAIAIASGVPQVETPSGEPATASKARRAQTPRGSTFHKMHRGTQAQGQNKAQLLASLASKRRIKAKASKAPAMKAKSGESSAAAKARPGVTKLGRAQAPLRSKLRKLRSGGARAALALKKAQRLARSAAQHGTAGNRQAIEPKTPASLRRALDAHTRERNKRLGRKSFALKGRLAMKQRHDQATAAAQAKARKLPGGLRGQAETPLTDTYIKVNASSGPATANGMNAVAIGSNALVVASGGLAVGYAARASADNAVAVGENSVANRARTFSVGSAGGERKIVNVADGDVGAVSTDAVNGRQLFYAISEFDGRMGVLDTIDLNFAIDGLQAENFASISGADESECSAMAFGVASSAIGINTAAFGMDDVALSDYAVAIGTVCSTGADSDFAVAIGSNASCTGLQTVAIGSNNVVANADYALAIGTNACQAIGQYSIAIGCSAKARSTDTVAIGNAAATSTGVINAVSLGGGTSVTQNGGVALGYGSRANRGTAVSVGNTSVGTLPIGTRQIIMVSPGTVGTDVVNVDQLGDVAEVIGASINPDGSIEPPTYLIDGEPYNDVGGAIDALIELSGVDTNAVSYDDPDKDTVTLSGDDGTLLTNLAPGGVSDSSLDGINGSQLYNTGESIAINLGGGAGVNADGTISPPSYTIDGQTPKDNVGDAFDAVNLELSNLQDVLDNSGLIDPATGELLAVTYTDDTKQAVTLGASGTPVSMTNLAPGALSDTSTDAVNGSQLAATNDAVSDLQDVLDNSGLIDPATGELLAVTYTDDTKQAVALGDGSSPVTVSNVAPGDLSVDSTEAVNGGQLTTGLANLKDELTDGAIDLKYIKVNSAGTMANANNTDAVAIGSNSFANAVRALAIGTGARALGDASVAIGYNALSPAGSNAFSVGQPGGERKIINVLPGSIEDSGTDAINGGQLFEMYKVMNAMKAEIKQLRTQLRAR